MKLCKDCRHYDGMDIPRAQVLIFQPKLTHSVWVDVIHQKRSLKSLEAILRKGVISGKYAGYRIIRVESEHIGITWPKSNRT